MAGHAVDIKKAAPLEHFASFGNPKSRDPQGRCLVGGTSWMDYLVPAQQSGPR